MKIPNLLAPGYLHSLLIKAKIQEQNGRFLTHYALGTVSGLIRAQAMANENATRDSLMASMRIQGAFAGSIAKWCVILIFIAS